MVKITQKDDGYLVGGDGDDGHNRNPAREAQPQWNFLRDYFNNEGAVTWQDDRI